jgi:hypothetical protein
VEEISLAKRIKKTEEKELSSNINKEEKDISEQHDWESLEKEFRALYKSGVDRSDCRFRELKELALNNEREFVIYGTSSWLVEFVYEEPEENIETRY